MTRVFYKGFEAEIVAEVPSDKSSVIISTTEDLSLDRGRKIGETLYVPRSELQPLIYERFVVGAPVRNKFGSMVGKITAFEYHINSAVVISDLIDKYSEKRIRYVYGVHELEEYDANAFEFKPGRWYIINKKVKLLAVESVFNLDDVMLFNLDGKIVYRGLPKKTNLNWLQVKHCINTIKAV